MTLPDAPALPWARGGRWYIVGLLLSLPLYVHVVGGGVRLATGHAETRLVGFYFPLLLPLAGALIFVLRGGAGSRPRYSREVRRLVFWLVFALIAIYVSVTSGLYSSPNYPIVQALPFIAQSTLPLIFVVLLIARAPTDAQRSGILRGFVDGSCLIATLLVGLRWVVAYDSHIGYPDDFGVVGIPSSLRFFPTVVAVAGGMGLYAWVHGTRRGLIALVTLGGAVSLVLYSHSRTALLVLAVAGMLTTGRLYRRSAVAFVGLNLALLLIAAASITAGGATSVERLVDGSGDSDANRLGRTLNSLTDSLREPFGRHFVPSEAVETRAGVRITRVVTAENQFGTVGVSAGPLGLVSSLGVAASIVGLAVRGLRSSVEAQRVAACGALCLTMTSLFQISLSHSLVGPLLGIMCWLTLDSGAPPSSARSGLEPGVTMNKGAH